MTTISKDSLGASVQTFRIGRVVQGVTVGASSQSTSAFGNSTRIVRLVSTVDCHVRMGSGAVATDSLFPANVVEYVAVRPGEIVSVIQDSSGGTLYVTEME